MAPHAKPSTIYDFHKILIWHVLIQQMSSSGFVSASMSTLMYNYGFSNQFAAVMLSGNSISKLLFGPVIVNYLDKGDIPRIMSWMCLGIAACNFALAFPGLVASLTNSPEDNVVCEAPIEGERFLDDGVARPVCSLGESTIENGHMKWILLFACLLNGVITAPLFPLAPAHINANAPPHIASGLCAKFYMMPPLATAFGWVLMGIFLALDLYYIGFVFVAIAHLYMATIYWKLPTKPTKITDKAAVTPVATTATPDPMGQGTNQLQSRRGSSLMDPATLAALPTKQAMLKRTTSLLTNKVWLLTTFGSVTETFVIGAYSSFGTVFMENFFSVPKSMAPLLAGGIIVPAAAWGTWYGGTHEAKYHTKLTQTAFWNVKMACISLVAAVLQATQSCSNPDIKGVNMNDFSFEAPACAVNASCGCSQTYQPLCFNDEVTYFSPCHAGCTDWMKKEGDRVENGINSTACSCWEGEEIQPTDGICSSQVCENMALALFILFTFIFFTFQNNTTVQIMLMRSVPTEDSAYSLAVHAFFWNLMDIPGTAILGYLFDSACVVEDAGTCQRSAGCAVFDNEKMASAWATYFGVGGKFVSMCFMTMAWQAVKGTQMGEEEHHEQEENASGGKIIKERSVARAG